MASVPQESGSLVWPLWAAANAVGTALGLAAVWGLAPVASRAGELAAVPLFGVAGALAGALQGLVLRRRVRGLRGWVVASAAGLAAGVAVLAVLFGLSVGLLGEESGAGLAVGAAAGGAVAGAAQWLVLRRRVPRAGWWVPASAAGMAACVVLFLGVTRGADAGLAGIAGGGAAGGAAYGLITGGALVWLLRGLGPRGAAGPGPVA
jgi:hypothetical protein